MLKVGKPTVNPLFRIVSNGTGIHEDRVGGIRLFRQFISLFVKNAVDDFRIREIHLATVGLYVDRSAHVFYMSVNLAVKYAIKFYRLVK